MVEEKNKYLFDKIFQKIQMMSHVTFLGYMCEQAIGVHCNRMNSSLDMCIKSLYSYSTKKLFHLSFVSSIISNSSFVAMLIFSCKYYLWLKFMQTIITNDVFKTSGSFYCIRIKISKLLWNQMYSLTFNYKSWFLMLCYMHVNIFLDHVKQFIKVWLIPNIFFI
jgi:hypothetical protein